MAAYSPLASAAAGATNPFGLPIPPRTGSAIIPDLGVGGQSSQSLAPPQQPRGQQKSPTQTPVLPIPITPATTPGAAGAPTPTVNTSFDLQTDPALQKVNAIAGLSDDQANAQALKERQQQLLAYGDPKLAAAVLGQNDPFVQAAAQNQESQLAMLGRQRDQNLRDFETQLDPSLTFSGYRVGQEQRLGQAYQDALAQAAAGVQGNLDTIASNLNAELTQNNATRANALDTADTNRTALILAGLGGGTGGPPPPISSDAGGNSTLAPPISPPQMNAEPSLVKTASSLFNGAGGSTGGNTPIISGDEGSQALMHPNLLKIAASLYNSAGGATGGNKPITTYTGTRFRSG